MARRPKYGSYDPRIKALISRTGRTDLFPDLKIPRTTALYWISQGYEIEDPLLDSLASTILEMRQEQVQSAAALIEAQTTTNLLKDVYEILGHRLRWKHIDSAKTRDRILEAITTAMTGARRNTCLETLDLSLSRYKRWKREKRGCGLPAAKTCPKYSNNQLTFHEIQIMSDLVTSKEYAHFPIESLHHYARRKGLLYCTYSTWRKYINQYGWLRPRKKRRKKYLRVGIRASRPNQIWHLDVSHFEFPNGTKGYIQAIVDNYSRYVVAWQVLSSYDGSKTASLLEAALKRATRKKLSSRSPTPTP